MKMKSFWVYDKNNKKVYAIPLRNILDTLNVLVGIKSNIIYFDNEQSAKKIKKEFMELRSSKKGDKICIS